MGRGAAEGEDWSRGLLHSAIAPAALPLSSSMHPLCVFVSYSHRDESFLASLGSFLSTLESEQLTAIWSDTRLRSGDRWQQELDAALDRATVVILLISQEFLASTFVREHELPRILRREAEGRLMVLPVFVSPSTVRTTSITLRTPEGRDRRIVLSDFQGIGTPEHTLLEMESTERQRRFIELHARIRELSGAGPARPSIVAGDKAGSSVRGLDNVHIELISDFERSERVIEEALRLYERRIPRDEQYTHEDMVGIVRRHLSDEYGPHWKMHFLVAKRGDHVVGLLIGYDDLQSNFTFVSYLANDKHSVDSTNKERTGRAGVELTGRLLAESLLDASRRLRPEGASVRFVFEIDSPDVAEGTERRRRAGRFKLFEQFCRFAPFKGLRLRVIDIPYQQPPLGWPPRPGGNRPLLLCYAAPNLASSLPKTDVVKMLEWVYLSLYDSTCWNTFRTERLTESMLWRSWRTRRSICRNQYLCETV